MDSQRNITYLETVDLKKKTIVQSQKLYHQPRIQERLWPYQVQITTIFPFQALITNVQITINSTNYQQQMDSRDTQKNSAFNFILENTGIFIGLQIEVGSLEHRGHNLQMIDSTLSKDENKIIITGAALTNMIKFRFFTRSGISKKKSKSELQKQITIDFQDKITEINLYGVSLNSYPPPNLLTKLLNISQQFKKFNMNHEAAQTQLLAALSLINARRYVQASEILKKISRFYVDKHLANRTALDFSHNMEKSWIREGEQFMISSVNLINSFTTRGRLMQNNKYLIKAAKIELLIAESILNPSLITQKLAAYYRCNAYHEGNGCPSPLTPDTDLDQICSKISPHLIPFLVKMLSQKLEPYRIAGLKSIEFFMETLGCSIGPNILLILKQVIATYPNNIQQNISNSSLSMIEFLSDKFKNSKNINPQGQNINGNINQNSKTKSKTLIDHYHHLLQTMLSVVGQLSRKILSQVFSEIVMPAAISKQNSQELKLYLLRFVQKILLITGPNVNIQASFVASVITLCENKPKKDRKSANNHKKTLTNRNSGGRRDIQSATHRPVYSTLIYFSHKVLNILKTKILPFVAEESLESILVWINKILTYFSENQSFSSQSKQMLFVFMTILDLINSLYSQNTRFSLQKITNSPVDLLLFFLNIAVHQNDQNILPFEKILGSFQCVVKHFQTFKAQVHKKIATIYISEEIVTRILDKSKDNNLTLKQLKVLAKILPVAQNCSDQNFVQWFQQFLHCVPHSTFDETYEIFIIFVKKIHKIQHIEDSSRKKIFDKIIKTLLDQYTVKGKAYHEAKDEFLALILENIKYTEQVLRICLFDNKQPKIEGFYRNQKHKKINCVRNIKSSHPLPDNEYENKFDAKRYQIQQQIFVQKTNIVHLIFAKTLQMIQKNNKKEMLKKNYIILGFLEQKTQHEQTSNIFDNFFTATNRLATSKILKVRNKALNLMNYMVDISQMVYQNFFAIILPVTQIVFFKNIFSFYKQYFSNTNRDSKIMYNILFGLTNLGRKFQQIIFHKSQDSIKNESYLKIDKIFQNILQHRSNQSNSYHGNLAVNFSQLASAVNNQFMIEKIKRQQVYFYLKNSLYFQILKLWAFLNSILSSPWEHARQMLLVLVLQIFKGGLHTICEPIKNKAIQILIPLTLGLLKSNDSKQRIFGLKIAGTLLGLRIQIFQQNKKVHLTQNDERIREIFKNQIANNSKYSQVLHYTILEISINDWCLDAREIAENIIQIAIVKDKKESLKKKIDLQRRISNCSILDTSFLGIINFQNQNNQFRNSSFTNNNVSQNLQNLLMKQSHIFDDEIQVIEKTQTGQIIQDQSMTPQINNELFAKIMEFRKIVEDQFISKNQNLCENQSFLVQAQQQIYQLIGDERVQGQNDSESIQNRQINNSQQQQLQFQDLGIIQLDDEEQQWGEDDDQFVSNKNTIQTQYAHKKMYNYKHKLSPSVIVGSSKPQRIRSKRYHHNEYQSSWGQYYQNGYKQRIIVDELEQKQKNIAQPTFINNQQTRQKSNFEAQKLQHTKNRPKSKQNEDQSQESQIDSNELQFGEKQHYKLKQQTKINEQKFEQFSKKQIILKEKQKLGDKNQNRKQKRNKKSYDNTPKLESLTHISATLPNSNQPNKSKKTSSRKRRPSTGK